jgi:hypothetical protein
MILIFARLRPIPRAAYFRVSEATWSRWLARNVPSSTRSGGAWSVEASAFDPRRDELTVVIRADAEALPSVLQAFSESPGALVELHAVDEAVIRPDAPEWESAFRSWNFFPAAEDRCPGCGLLDPLHTSSCPRRR